MQQCGYVWAVLAVAVAGASKAAVREDSRGVCGKPSDWSCAASGGPLLGLVVVKIAAAVPVRHRRWMRCLTRLLLAAARLGGRGLARQMPRRGLRARSVSSVRSDDGGYHLTNGVWGIIRVAPGSSRPTCITRVVGADTVGGAGSELRA